MQNTYIPSITDDLLAEIEAECRASDPSNYGAASNAQTLSMIRRLRESEARLLSLCAAHTLGDTDRMGRELADAMRYLNDH